MNLIHRSDYIIFIDDVRVDQYVVNWNSNISLTPDAANASITFFRSPEMDEWKAYLSKVKIFAENPFTRKYFMVFEGDITSRSYSESRKNSGFITFQCKGFYHWLDVQIPMGINATDDMNPLQRFIYEAQNINIDEVRTLITSNADILMKDNNVQGIIDQLFEKITVGYYEAASEDTNFAFSKIKERFKILCDVNDDFRESGFLDLFTFSKASLIDSFLTFFMEVVEQLMMEFYQDRDGSFKVKFPYWHEEVMKSHILDASFVGEVSGLDQWDAEPTRVLAIGGATQLQQALENRGVSTTMTNLTMPVGLYIGNPRIPETEEYYSSRIQLSSGTGATGSTGTTGGFEGSGTFADGAALEGKTISTADWFDNLGNYAMTSGHRTVNRSRPKHQGTDYGTKYDNLYNIGTHGVVTESRRTPHQTGGYWVTIRQTIDGTSYDFSYMHLNKPSPLEVGQKVYPGQFIGQSGATGGARTAKLSGPMKAHLHLEIWRGPRGKGNNDIDGHAFLLRKRAQYANAEKITPGSNVNQPVVTNNAPTTSGNRYIDFNTVKGFRPQFGYTGPLDKAGDENVTINNNVPLATLQKYCRGKLANYAQSYYKYGNQYGIDPAFCVAISMWETGWGKVVTNNNVGGLMVGSRKLTFPTLDAGIKAFIDNLSRLYIKEGLITPRLIQQKYAPNGASNDPTGLNANWIKGVVALWNQIRGNVSSETQTSFSPHAAASDTGISIINTSSGFKRVTTYKQKNNGKVNVDELSVSKGMTYTKTLPATVPSFATKVKSSIDMQSGIVAPKLLEAVIKSTSNWNFKYNNKARVGIAAYPKSKLLNDAMAVRHVMEPEFSITEASRFLKECIDTMGKVTLGVAAYLVGGPEELRKAMNTAGATDFLGLAQKAKSAEYIQLTQKIISDLVSPNAEFLNGDFHKSMVGKYIEEGGFVKKVGENGELITVERDDTGEFIVDPNASDAYKAKLSDEERMYKVNLIQVSQELIRLDSPALSGETTTDLSAHGYGEAASMNAPTLEATHSRVLNDFQPSSYNLESIPRRLRSTVELASTVTSESVLATDVQGSAEPAESVETAVDSAYDNTAADMSAALDGLIYMYAKYNMQLSRAMSHNVTVPLTLCMPHLRPGFNMWLEPTRRNIIFYATGISHGGSFAGGVTSTINGAFVRDPNDYQDVAENIFIGPQNVSSKDFGPTVPKAEMATIRESLATMHKQAITSEAHKVPTLSKLYSVESTSNEEYTTQWNSEKTLSQIVELVALEYSSAPDIIKQKIKKTKEVFDKSKEFFVKMLHQTFN